MLKHVGVAPSRYRFLLAEEAARAGLDFRAALAKRHTIAHARVRWRVWRALYATGRYSLPGIAQAGGFHHTTVMHGIRRINIEEPMNKPVDNFSALAVAAE